MNKYRAIPTVVDGIKFHSKGEAGRYSQLKLLERGGQIKELRRQVLFHLHGKNGTKVGRYTIDFLYTENDSLVAEDFKGFSARDMPMRIALFKDNFPDIEFRLTGRAA